MFADHRCHEIAASHIVGEVTEQMAAERIIAHILENAAAVDKGMSVLQFLRRCVGEAGD